MSPARYIVEIWDSHDQDWKPTGWTRGGLPACEVTAQARLEEARAKHPEVPYQLREVLTEE